MLKLRAYTVSSLLALLVPMMLTLGANASANSGRTGETLDYGKWRIAKLLGHSAIADMPERSARALVGRPVLIEKARFVFDGEICEAPSYAQTRGDTALVLREKWHASTAKLGLPDPVISFDAGCTTLFVKGPRSLVVPWAGYFFEVVPVSR